MKQWMIALATVTALLAGCGKGKDSSSQKLTIAVIPKGTTHVFWKSVKAGADRAAAEEKAEILWQGPSSEQATAEQLTLVQSMKTRGVSAMCLAPNDAGALAPAVDEFWGKTPVVIYDSDVSTDKYASFIATDNERGGRLAGERMLKLLGDAGGDIAMVRFDPGSASTNKREKGFEDVIKQAADKNTKIRIVYREYANDVGKAQTAAVNALTNNPNLRAFYGSNESTTTGILKALNDKKDRAAGIRFVGFDSTPELAQALVDKKIDALVLQDPVQMGYKSVKAAAAAVRGEKVEKQQPIDPTLATSDNLGEEKVKSLLWPKLD